MRKFLLFALLIVLALSLTLVACQTDDKVTIVPEALTLDKGTAVDWKGHVTVTVNDNQIDNPDITWTLTEGDDKAAGTCKYTISFVYNDKEYTCDGIVTFVEETVRLLLIGPSDIIQLTVGDNINWSTYVKAYLDNKEVAATLTATLKSGDENEEGTCVYEISCEQDGETAKTQVSVRYVAAEEDNSDLEALKALFAKEYDSYKFTYYYYEVGNEQYYIRETDKVIMSATSLWQIDYEFVDADETGAAVTSDLLYYISFNDSADDIRLYFEYSTDNGKVWQYHPFSYSADYLSYYDYLPYSFMFSEISDDVLYSWFEKVADNKYAAKQDFIKSVAQGIFEQYDDNQTYTSIEITTDGENITQVVGRYTINDTVIDESTGEEQQVSIDAVIEYTWSDFDNASFTLPEATEYVPVNENERPEYVDPTTATELTTEQQTALAEALIKTYESYTCMYFNDKGDMNYFYAGMFTLTPTASYVYEYELAQYLDWIIEENEEEYFFSKISDTNSDIWMIIDAQGDFIKYSNQSLAITVWDPSIFVSEFGFTADMFGYADGTYVVMPDKIEQLTAKISEVLDIDGLTKFEILSFEIKMDSNKNVTEWRFVADCIESGDAYYWDLTFDFSEFNSAEIKLPNGNFDNLEDLTDEQQTELNQALNADYSNVTILDCIDDYTMYIVGDNTSVRGVYKNEQFEELYTIENGKYFEVDADGVATEITKADYDEWVLNYDFTQIDVTKVKYDTVQQAYYISAEDIDKDAFALYFKGFYGTDADNDNYEYVVTAFSFEIDEGHVVSVTAYFENGRMTATGVLSEFGTTTIPQDTEQGTTED